MNNTYFKIIEIEDKNLKTIVNTFIIRLEEYSLEINLSKFIEQSNKLVNSLIDVCIKNKINYYIENHISFTSIKSNFKLELEKILIKIINIQNIENNFVNMSNDEILNTKTIDEWNNILFKLSKNKVSFSPTMTEYSYNENNNLTQSKKKSKPIKIEFYDKEEITNENKLSILLKIICMEQKKLNVFKKYVYKICDIITNEDIEYNIMEPYKILYI
jgi:hypothetical protein